MRFLRLLIPIFVLATGCKQDLGERCQIDSDCIGEARCSPDGICRLDVTGSVNADAGPADAAIDASLEEEEVDAAPGTPDATTVDAPPDEPDASEADAG